MPAMAKSAVRRVTTTANASPNDALMRDAPGYGTAIAAIWPRPHTPYFEADRPRRLLVAWLARHKNLGPEAAEACETWSLRRLVSAYAPDAPEGLIEALRRAEDAPWSTERLGRLFYLLEEGGEGQKTLRHAKVIYRRQVDILTGLPPPQRRGRNAAILPTPHKADLIQQAVRQCWGRSPDPQLLRRLADRLERAPRAETLFGWLVEEVGLDRLTPPPIPATDWLKPILSVRDIERTALKFQNCLRNRIPLMLRGAAAYFEVLGDEPAVVELLAGRGVWGIGEVRGHANGDISQTLMARLYRHLAQQGAVASGRHASPLALALADAAGW